MSKRVFIILLVSVVLGGAGGVCVAQSVDGDFLPSDRPALSPPLVSSSFLPSLPGGPSLPRLAPELALDLVQKRAAWQSEQIVAVSDTEHIDAHLPETSQRGSFELVREYTAPNALKFTPVKFTGDGFVKQNVIGRLLQSEVEHVERGEGASTALTPANYKFSYKGTENLDGRDVHVFQVKPRRKQPGLFKGKIYVDVETGSLRRAEGTLAKSPSLFIKRIEFVQDYVDIGAFTFPLRMRSVAVTRVIGRAIVNIFHRDYQPRTLASAAATAPLAGSGID